MQHQKNNLIIKKKLEKKKQSNKAQIMVENPRGIWLWSYIILIYEC